MARARLPAPTGIDRVERAYLGWVLAGGGRFLCRAGGRLHEVPPDAVRALTGWLDGQGAAPAMDWRARLAPARDPRLRRAQSLVRREGTRVPDAPRPDGARSVYLNVGHDNLTLEAMAALGRAGWRRAVFLHDTIPLDHPETIRPGTEARFRRMLTAAGAAELLLANSRHTAARVGCHLPGARAEVLPLGLAWPGPGAASMPELRRAAPSPARFVALGTIEPRKDHALLLDVWGSLPDGADAPRLDIVGRRGWNNAAVFRRLDGDPTMGRTVHELGPLDDAALGDRLAGATALVFPSRAEGYGLPLIEALARGIPVLASDLPALREAGADVPDYLPPGDVAAWHRAILAYAAPGSPARAAQIARLAAWEPPNWQTHFARLGNLLETILAQPLTGR